MGIARIGKHLLHHHWWQRRYFPPKVLAKVWLYARSMKFSSSRRVEFALWNYLDFIWLAQGFKIDHVTLANFRTRFKDQLQDLFRQVVKIAMA